MATKSFNLIFFTLIFALLAFLIYSLNTRQPRQIVVYNENVPSTVHSEWWGYGWRPYWRKYDGIPGVKPDGEPAVKPDGQGDGKPLPAPKLPVPPKPIIIKKT